MSRGGGVLLAINNKYACKEIDVSRVTNSLPSIDLVEIKVTFNVIFTVCIFGVYIPP